MKSYFTAQIASQNRSGSFSLHFFSFISDWKDKPLHQIIGDIFNDGDERINRCALTLGILGKNEVHTAHRAIGSRVGYVRPMNAIGATSILAIIIFKLQLS